MISLDLTISISLSTRLLSVISASVALSVSDKSEWQIPIHGCGRADQFRERADWGAWEIRSGIVRCDASVYHKRIGFARAETSECGKLAVSLPTKDNTNPTRYHVPLPLFLHCRTSNSNTPNALYCTAVLKLKLSVPHSPFTLLFCTLLHLQQLLH